MPLLTEMDPQGLHILLGSDLKNPFPAGFGPLNPDPNKRTLFIALGGSGVQTIDHLKGLLRKRMQPGWEHYVGFLGIDSDFTELDKVCNLNRHMECCCLTRPGNPVHPLVPAAVPHTVRRLLPENQAPQLFPAANASRLKSKLQIYHRGPGELGVDEEIVNKIHNTLLHMQPLPPFGCYEVFLVAGTGGYTGSGCFTELPALVRRAIQPHQHHIHSVLYLPDVHLPLMPHRGADLRANAYALLKELNYYQGVSMRPDYPEPFVSSHPGNPLVGLDTFLDVPYLVGNPWHHQNALSEAVSHTAELLLSKVLSGVGMPPAMPVFKATDPTNPHLEARGWSHEFPSSFAAFGIARAAMPADTIRAYWVSRVLERVGLTFPNTLPDPADSMPPWTGLDDLSTAAAGNRQAEELLAPLRSIFHEVNNCNFQFLKDLKLLPEEVTVRNIRDGMFDRMTIRHGIARYVERSTGPAREAQLRDRIREQYRQFRTNVQRFVEEHGPFAFMNLFFGRFIPANGDPLMGLRDMLKHLREYRHLNGRPIPMPIPEQLREDLSHKRQEIDQLNFIQLVLHQHRLADEWMRCVEAVVREEVNRRSREMMFGSSGILEEEFLKPARALAAEVGTLGHILKSLYAIYDEQGQDFASWERFRAASDDPAQTNIAGDFDIFRWILDEVEQQANWVNPQAFRNRLVDHFFSDPRSWLEVDPRDIRQGFYGMELVSPTRPITVRKTFEDLLAEMISLNLDLSVEHMASKAAHPQLYLRQMILMLNHKSLLRFHGEPNHEHIRKRLYYPASLPAHHPLAQAIFSEATTLGIHPADVIPWDDESIAMTQEATNMELYRIYDLPGWEMEYRMALQRYPCIHSNSPDVETSVDPQGEIHYIEGQPWRDYPSIVYNPRWEEKDPHTGTISQEGRLRLTLREEMEKARHLGVLFSEQTPNGWVIQRVHCDTHRSWEFDVDFAVHPETELAPQGKALAEEVAQQNGIPLNDMTRVVRLENAGLFSQPAATEEYAWEYAHRVLRAHAPMMAEIRRTVKRFEAWDAQCREWNLEVLKKVRPSLLLPLLEAGILRVWDNIWFWDKENPPAPLLGYFSLTDPWHPDRRRSYLANGLKFYALWQKVEECMAGEILFREADRAKALLENNPNLPEAVNSEAILEKLKQECQALLEKGMSEDPDCDTLKARFAAEMREIEPDQNVLLDIQRFYATVWQQF